MFFVFEGLDKMLQKKTRGVGLLGCLIGFVYRDPNQIMIKSSTSTVTVRRGITQIHLYGCFQK